MPGRDRCPFVLPRYNLRPVTDTAYPYQPEPGEPLTRGAGAAVLWGAFLGSSWTWVIGMVLPALLLRDYGLLGWIAFAVPNVLGATAMGAVLYRPAWSVAIVRKHAAACQQFSVITVAYHLFVVAWLFGRLFGLAAVPMLVVAIALCATIGFRNRRSAMLIVAAVVTLLSWGCFSWATQGPGAWALTQWAWPAEGVNRLTTFDLWMFVPCALTGFALCPYLDLTFHRARINTSPGTGVAAFAFGFCVVFCLMIVFSICYGGQLLPFVAGESDAELAGFWLVLLGLHLSLQAGFTITVHVRELIEDASANRPWLVAAGGVAILLGLLARLSTLPASPITGGLTWGEAGYRGFLLFYGTIFPAYVWLVMIPTRGRLTPRARSIRRSLFAGSCGLTYVLGWLAFVMGHSRAIPAIFGVLLVARVVVELLPRETSPPADAS